jgi:hypothetical protein
MALARLQLLYWPQTLRSATQGAHEFEDNSVFFTKSTKVKGKYDPLRPLPFGRKQADYSDLKTGCGRANHIN